MASRADVARLQAANRSLSALAVRDLEAFWRTLPLSRPEAARDALLAFLPLLTAQYGELAATVAAEWYEELRASSGVTTPHSTVLADPVPEVAVQSRVRYAASHLFTDEPAGTLGILDLAVNEYSLQQGRDTIVRNVKADRARPAWARVPSGGKTCAFCLMLASRGPIYASAHGGDHVTQYHANCDCVPTPIWPDDALPAGYDPDALARQVQQADEAAGSDGMRAVLSELRQQRGSN